MRIRLPFELFMLSGSLFRVLLTALSAAQGIVQLIGFASRAKAMSAIENESRVQAVMLLRKHFKKANESDVFQWPIPPGKRRFAYLCAILTTDTVAQPTSAMALPMPPSTSMESSIFCTAESICSSPRLVG